MANIKEIQKRMKSINDTLKITNAMYMISSTKLQQAKKKLENVEPYFYALQNAIRHILRHIPDTDSIYFKDTSNIPASEKRIAYIVFSADKGLAGAYNHNVFKMAHELFEQGGENKLLVLGELGRQYFEKEGLEIDTQFKYTVQNPTLHRARLIRERVLELYLQEEVDEVYVIYTRMENSMTVVTEKSKVLPLSRAEMQSIKNMVGLSGVYYEELKAEPSWEDILNHVVPNYINGFVYGALVEAFVSEHNSRMMAMQSATDSAKKILQQLNIEYNRLRQAAITQEITEVISGAKAQKRKKRGVS